jgi:hypothetical protein
LPQAHYIVSARGKFDLRNLPEFLEILRRN